MWFSEGVQNAGPPPPPKKKTHPKISCGANNYLCERMENGPRKNPGLEYCEIGRLFNIAENNLRILIKKNLAYLGD